MKRYTIAQLRQMRESEDHVEFKKGEHGNVSYNGAGQDHPKDRRKCILGYVTALCNEGGGRMVVGMHDKHPHHVVGTTQNENALGELESNIYCDTDIRTSVYELYEDEANKTGRVLVIEVPSRPIGKVYKFEDVPLMRVGEELLPMDDKTYLSIIQEQEPDFSEQFCDNATFEDLDIEAIKIMKEKYAKKQDNPSFVSLDDRQALSDLHLIVDNHVTNAAVLLVGTNNKQIAQKLDQMGFLEKHGKTNAIYYILPRRYYELAGDVAAYSLATDWDINQVWAVIELFLKKYERARISDLEKLIGSHVSEKLRIPAIAVHQFR